MTADLLFAGIAAGVLAGGGATLAAALLLGRSLPARALLLAAAAVAVFAAYGIALDGDPPLAPGDTEARELAHDLRDGGVVDVLAVLTDLGAFPLVAALVLAGAVLLARRGRRAESAALVAGLGLLVASVYLAKAGFGRPRPEDALTASDGAAYPSGHAAYSTAYLAVAIAAGRDLARRSARAWLLAGAAAIAVFVGLSRVYLQVHYWSDVVGGWALGCSVFSISAAVAVLAARLRHNGAELATARDRG